MGLKFRGLTPQSLCYRPLSRAEDIYGWDYPALLQAQLTK